MDKKYLVSGVKNNEEYFYKDLEAHERLDSLSEKVDGHFTAVEEAFKNTVDKKTFDETVEGLEEAITDLQTAGPEIDIDAFEEKINTAIEEAKNAAINEHNVDLETVKNEIKRFHHQGQSFEITKMPEGTLVDYNCKEIRILCPENFDWENYSINMLKSFDNSENYRFIEFCAYAPDTAESYKEKVSYDYEETLDESSMKTPYINNDIYEYAGINDAGRKFSVYYFPVAENKDGVWHYLGEKSTITDYNGWNYSIEWYDSAIENSGSIVKASTVRVNLAADALTFRYIEPALEHSIWAKYLDLSEKYQALLARIETLEEREK